MSSLEMKINPLINDLRACLENKLYYASLSLALTIPDICSSIRNRGKTNHTSYKYWINDYFYSGNQFNGLTSGDIYSLRCAFLHNGKDDISSQRSRDKHDKFIFYNSSSNIKLYIGNVPFGKDQKSVSTVITTVDFCEQIILAAVSFVEQNKNNKHINEEADRTLKFETDWERLRTYLYRREQSDS